MEKKTDLGILSDEFEWNYNFDLDCWAALAVNCQEGDFSAYLMCIEFPFPGSNT